MANTLLQIGDKSPDFNLPDSNGRFHTLDQFKGKWLVLYFYPKDDTSSCTSQACGFRDDHSKFEDLGAVVVGISVDNSLSHAKFAKKYSLPFTLLSDARGTVAERFGAITNLGFFSIAKRYTFLIDSNGLLQKCYFDVNTLHHSQEILNDLVALKQI